MSLHIYTEEHLVEQPAIELFAKLGWHVASPHPHPSPLPRGEGVVVDDSGLFGRESLGEVVLEPRLRTALRRLNPMLPSEAIDAAVEELRRDRSAMSLVAANREVYALLKQGILVSVADEEFPAPSPRPVGHPSPSGRGDGGARGVVDGVAAGHPSPNGRGDGGEGRGEGQRLVRIRVVDWENPANNDFLLVSQLSIQGPLYKCRPDLVGFVNGLPFVIIELKKPGVPARNAFDENLTSYKHPQNGIPKLFAYNALLIASNGTDSRVGSLTADWDRFFEWKRIGREDEPRRVSLEVMLRGTCDKARLLDLVENFTLFSEHKAGLVKIIAQNHQYLGVNNAITAMREARRQGHGRGGVFWQTQGSGKSFSMVFFAQKVLRKLAGNWTFVVVTDRVELDDQIAKTFKITGAVGEAEGDACHAASGAHLRELLRGNHRYVFTLIHKFRFETPSSPALLPGGEGSGGGGDGGGDAGHYRGGLWYSGLVDRARALRRKQTHAEKIVWELLRDRRFGGLKFRRQHQINHYIADFFCAEHRLVIELDGNIHEVPEVMRKDKTRDAMLHALGFKVLRFPNQLILNHPDAFLSQIATATNTPTPLPLPPATSTPLPSPLGRRAGDEGIMPVLCTRHDVIVMTDEAHRSQYDTLAVNMRAALPKATFLAFTGTPLIAGEERTKEVFGDYVSIYDFQQSVEDGATVPLFYENRTPELQLVNPDLNEDIYKLIEAAELDPGQEARLERELSRQYHILTRDDRLETVAKDIVRHFLGRGFIGKAMVVSIDKATALKMHDKVRKHWTAEQQRVEKEIAALAGYSTSQKQKTPEAAEASAAKLRELQQRLHVLRTTDMALIVSPAQNEIEQMKKLGLDIVPHRKRMNETIDPGLDEKFKDPADPLRLVFVCAMWLTGFDAPSCSTLYLDKPMRNHSLMQTIARANRVFPGKQSGIIVDYANVFASLEKALAIYGAGKNGETPLKKKSELADELRKALAAAVAFCARRGVDIVAIETLPAGSLARLDKMDAAVNALISPDALRGEFLAHQRFASLLYKAVKPDPSSVEFAGRMACLTAIAGAIQTTLNPSPVDISAVMEDIQGVLDESISGVAMPAKPGVTLDLSKIDFEALAKQFKKSKTKNTGLEILKAAVRAQLEKLVRLNRTRTDYLDKFEDLIESYNNGSRNVEELYAQLLELSRALNDEQQRHVRENLSEEELVIFDILTRPAPAELTGAERDEVKKVTRELLSRLQGLLVLNWKEKASSRSQLKLAIEDALDNGLPRAYTKELYRQKCAVLFEHVYENYNGEGRGAYSQAA
jgi:type I site-specific restriction-modification system R (restriction) subunit